MHRVDVKFYGKGLDGRRIVRVSVLRCLEQLGLPEISIYKYFQNRNTEFNCTSLIF